MSPSASQPNLPEVNIMEGGGVRYMHFETPWIQGAMRVERPDEIELDYVQRMMVWMLFRDEAEVTRGHVLQLGLGAATLTRFCHKRLKMRTTAVELNPRVIAACRLWFRLPRDSQRLAVLEMDAGAYVADPANNGTADVLSVDLYDQEAARPVLDSVEFYRDCRAVLGDGGVMTVNLFGRRSSYPASLARGRGRGLRRRPGPCAQTDARGQHDRHRDEACHGSRSAACLPGVPKTSKLDGSCPPASGCAC